MVERLKGGEVGSYPKKLFVCAHGFAGSGKTTLALTFPPPLYFLNCDRDARHLLAKLPSHYDIYYEWLIKEVDTYDPQTAATYVTRAGNLIREAIKSGTGTVIIDGVDVLWEYVTTALVPPEGTALRYKAANEAMFGILTPLSASPLQVVVTALAQEIWDGPRSTGRYTHGGFKHIDRYILTDLRTYIVETVEAGEKPTPVPNPTVTHAAYVEQSKLSEHMLRRIIERPSFALLYKMTFGEPWPEEDKLWHP